jgi:hypothetical protein
MRIKVGNTVQLLGSLSLIGDYDGNWIVVGIEGSWLELEPADPKVRAAECGGAFGFGCERHEVRIAR